MLETRRLKKIYRPKHGPSVVALHDISISFPERGMVFLLGKSGSGKSTLLNLLGGLDKYDDGDILLDGVSTRKFSQSDFDSYRNACMGFIFQEYNVIPDFTVGVNIALAIELQGRKATEEEISDILVQVDLAGYENRRPNELSGGQMQRVAIARALVKNPKIILADEPTGALDSATGRQIFDLLKQLSRDKLVIIVSHDREYSEQYADRIIELKDGEILSDVTREYVTQSSGEVRPLFENGTCKVTKGYRLTDEDREAINEYLSEHPMEPVYIRVDENLTRGFVFSATKEQPSGGTSFFEKIRSKLPMSRAARIGIGGLRCKKLKLFFTVLMSVIAFSLFGIAATLADYNYTRSVSKVFRENGVSTVYVQKQIYQMYALEEDGGYWQDWGYNAATKAEWDTLNAQPGVTVFPVYRFPDLATSVFEEGDEDLLAGMMTNLRILTDYFEIDEQTLHDFGAKLIVGRLPDGSKDEVAISKVTYDMLRNGRLLNGKSVPKMEDMVGTKVRMDNGHDLVVTGIIDTGLDYLSVFTKITELAGELLSNDGRAAISFDMIKAYVMIDDFSYDCKCNLASKNLVGKGFVERQAESVLSYTETNMTRVDLESNRYVSTLGNLYDFYYGDINDVGLFKHVDIAAKSHEADTPELMACYIERSHAESLLYSLLTVNNRKYLGINDAVIACYNATIGVSDQNDDDYDEYDDYYYPDDKEYYEDEVDAKKGGDNGKDNGKDEPDNNGDGTEFIVPAKGVSRQERVELGAYLEILNDAAFAELFEKVYNEVEFTYEVQNYDDRDYEAVARKPRMYVTLDIKGILFTDKEAKNDPILLADLDVLSKGNIQPCGRVCGGMVILPKDRGDLERFIGYSHDGENNVRFHMYTKYNVELDMMELSMKYIDYILVGMGVFFAIFAALLMMSFIVSSIAYKKRDIGILRAIGSRGSDVYRIFGSESVAIAAGCFVLASLLTALLTGLANRFLVMTIHVSIMEFGWKQMLLIAAVSFGTALIASFLPVLRFAHKRPIDAIRGR
ncbi:MAG: ATP-binding cassette domain-containing protein [Lachnospiraceae bacterium]|nr:ATP-binding cassette domain-containing protein [Lachnospiraceae bacterium]